MEFIDESGDVRLIKIAGRHFSDYSIDIYKYDDEEEDYVYDHSAIFTASEVRRLAKAKSITWAEDEEG